MISPYKGTFRVSQAYRHMRANGTYHKGFDLVGISDKNIYCPIYGTVERAGWENPSNHGQGFGQYVRIRIGNTNYRMYFGHLSSIAVSVGQKVVPGQWLGVEGSTGHSTGSHCHWEIRNGTSPKSYVSIANYSSIPNSASHTPRQSGWGAELLGPNTLRRRGNCNSPEKLFNAFTQSVVGVNADGIFGGGTERAVKQYQAAHGLVADGLVGRKTKASMVEG